MKKRTCYIMIALMIGVIVSGAVFCVQMHRFTEIVYAKSAEDELAEELYCDSLELLAICVQAEAGNQPLIGRRMVADVILNRVDDPDWPDTIKKLKCYPLLYIFCCRRPVVRCGKKRIIK